MARASSLEPIPVRYFADGARTHSIVMDLVGSTVRFVDTVHLLSPAIIREIHL